MDRDEKRSLRHHIGQHLDVSNARMTDDEALTLARFVDQYDESYRGTSLPPRTRTRPGWGSDGKYIVTETYTDSFPDEVGIRQTYEYKDDDGEHRTTVTDVTDARRVLNWLRDQR